MNLQQMLVNYQEGMMTSKEPLWKGFLLTEFSPEHAQSALMVFNLLSKECAQALGSLNASASLHMIPTHNTGGVLQPIENSRNTQNLTLLAGYFEVLYKDTFKQNESQDRLIDACHEILSISLPKLDRLELVKIKEIMQKNDILSSDIGEFVQETLKSYRLINDLGTKNYSRELESEYVELMVKELGYTDYRVEKYDKKSSF